MSVKELNAKWSRGGLSFVERDGQPVAIVENQASALSISLYGGHILSWRPKGCDDVLWLSPATRIEEGKSMRGGVPVCWPWFGPCPFDAKAPMHGLARISFWRMESFAEASAEVSEITLGLNERSLPQQFKFQAFTLRLKVSVGKTLSFSLVTENSGSEPLSFSAGLHSYFKSGDIGKASVEGLDGFEYLDKVDSQEKRQAGIVRFTEKVDRIYRKAQSARLVDGALKRSVSVDNPDANAMVVWNPGEGVELQFPGFAKGDDRHFVCIEAAQPETRILRSGERATLTSIASIAAS